MTEPASQTRWRALKTGHKAAVGLIAFVSAVLTILLAVDQLGLINLGEDETALAAAAAKTSDAGSATVALARTTRAGQEVLEESAHGEIDFRAELGFLDYTSGMKQRFIKPYAYALGLPGSPEGVWCQYDLSILGRGFLFGALTGFENDPAQALVNLEEHGSYEEVGDETLFGIAVTHYSGEVELGELVEEDDNPEVREALELFSQWNAGRLPVDVWVSSDDDYVRRLATSIEVRDEESRTAQVDVTFDFSNFGGPVEVKTPPSQRVSPGGLKGCPATF